MYRCLVGSPSLMYGDRSLQKKIDVKGLRACVLVELTLHKFQLMAIAKLE